MVMDKQNGDRHDGHNRKRANAFHIKRIWVVFLLISGLNLPIISVTTRWMRVRRQNFRDNHFYDTNEDQGGQTLGHIAKGDNRTDATPTHHASAWPKVALLMSFPNSGTSYTGQVVRRATKTAIGTNYGSANLGQSGNSIPIFDWSPTGPFLTDPLEVASQKLTVPGDGSYIVTKSHCGGTCFGCPPKYYLQTQEEFQYNCLLGDYINDRVKLKATYDSSIVSKAIHLVRDPFDNVVSRFHLKRKSMIHKGDNTWLEMYPNTKEGFRAFCDYANTKYEREEDRYPVDGTDGNVFLKYRESIPCYSDFIRYILWHNNAVETIHELEAEYMVLHYESYGISHKRTTDKLLHFLGLEFTHKVEEFLGEKGYRDHFKENEVEAVKRLAEEISNVETWDIIERYFDHR
mmetsp:Transcript_24601/g.59307  ORF Transcript_24601/g.59307 Transcript_24601/m.59307 type:complete len:403 (-) Transcript_24601:146-1354(-)